MARFDMILGVDPVTHLTPAKPMRLFGNFEQFEPSREETWARWRKNFDPPHASKSKTAKDLNVEVVISSEAAQHSSSLALEVPIGRLCQDCEGSGVSGYFLCDSCEGHGMLWETRRVDVLLRAPVQDGTVVPVSLGHLGVTNLNLRVRVRVVA
jgi:DnaJ-class molecular chaperone